MAIEKGIPFPALTDTPNGPAQIEALAQWLADHGVVEELTTEQRNLLAGPSRWQGRTLWERLTGGARRLVTWDQTAQQWREELARAVHAAQHAAGGTDPVTPAAIGAAGGDHVHDSRYSRLRLVGRTSQVAAGASPPTVDSGLLTMQAGVRRGNTTVSGGIAVAFPVPFPTGLLTVVACNGEGEVSDPVNRSAVSVSQRSLTGFTADYVDLDSSGNTPPVGSTAQVNWVAVGW